METYYAVIFFIAAIFQEHVEGFSVASFCTAITLYNEAIVDYLSSLGLPFFLAPILISVGMVVVSVSFIGQRFSKILLGVSLVSIVVNIFFWVHYNPEGAYLYQIIQPYYKYINIILLEILVYSCLAHSRLVPLGKEYFMKARSWYAARNN